MLVNVLLYKKEVIKHFEYYTFEFLIKNVKTRIKITKGIQDGRFLLNVYYRNYFDEPTWRGTGKIISSFEEALSFYKKKQILIAVEVVKEVMDGFSFEVAISKVTKKYEKQK